MPKKKYNFVSVSMPSWLIKDIDDILIKNRRKESRASFIIQMIDIVLDQEAYRVEIINEKRENPSWRTQRHIAYTLLKKEPKPEKRDYLLLVIKELTAKIESGARTNKNYFPEDIKKFIHGEKFNEAMKELQKHTNTKF